MHIDLSGVFIPIATPFADDNGDLDTHSLRDNLDRWLETPVRGLVVGGSTGEAVLLEREERIAAIRTARSAISDSRLLVVGAGAESTRGTIRLIADAADSGADAVLVQPPAFYRGAMTPDALREHYLAVADTSEIPVILYQVPLRMSTVEFEAGLVAELSLHPRIVGIKDSRGDLGLLAELVTTASEGFQVLVGSGSRFYGALEVGAVGGILGVANLVAGPSAEIERAFRDNRGAEAGRLQELIAPLHDGIVGRFGVPGVKYALDLLGFRGGSPRSPLRPASADARSEIHELVDTWRHQSGKIT